jgi:hypothetical protein
VAETRVAAHLRHHKLSKDVISVTLEIQAYLPDGVPPAIVQTVKENCYTLRFESYGFEEE